MWQDGDMPFALLAVVASLALAPQPRRVNIFPEPSSVVEAAGEYRFARNPVIAFEPTCETEGMILREMLEKGGSHSPRMLNSPSLPRPADIILRTDPALTELGDEGYKLEIHKDGITIAANKPAGVFYGIQTLRQLLPPGIEDATFAKSQKWTVPCCEIQDRPRFPWRGMLLDVSRHFSPKQDIEHYLDMLAMLKMNVFHWHLVDDGGWRIEIKRYPQLTQTGAWRAGPAVGWNQATLRFPGPSTGEKLYGGFYTQEDVKEIVRYAGARHITVVPEIEMPGHSLAACAGIPSLACSISPELSVQESGSPIPNVYCAGKESTFEVLQNVLDEVFQLFPGQFIHIGGDEVDKFFWSHCPDCQKRMIVENLKTDEELQSYFIRRIEKYVNSKGKRLIGWDEILEGGLAPNAAVMSWRGIDGGITAAKAGHDVVMTPTSHCYFDYGYDSISTEHVLTFDPVPTGLTADEAKHILGGQCNLWTEAVPDRPTVEQRLFPRIVSMAQVLWSEQKEDVDSFMARLQHYYARLEALGLNFYIPKPIAEYDAVLLNGPSTVSFRPAVSGMVLRYTLDGSEPTARSPIYSRPISVAKPATITAAQFLKDTKSDSIRIQAVNYTPAALNDVQPGLVMQVFDGKFARVPDFAKLTPSSTGVASTLGLTSGKAENYAVAYTGSIRIERAGVYAFSVLSDDGSVLRLGGALVVDNDGLHAPSEKTGRVLLRPGVYHLQIGFFQAGGAQSFAVSIEGPGLTRQAIPLSMLSH